MHSIDFNIRDFFCSLKMHCVELCRPLYIPLLKSTVSTGTTVQLHQSFLCMHVTLKGATSSCRSSSCTCSNTTTTKRTKSCTQFQTSWKQEYPMIKENSKERDMLSVKFIRLISQSSIWVALTLIAIKRLKSTRKQ